MKKTKNSINFGLLLLVLALVAYGLVALHSASTVESFKNFGNTYYYIKHQLIYGVGIGLAALYIGAKVDYHVWQKYLPWLIFGSLGLLAMVKLSSLGLSANGAERWLVLGPFTFQPSELAKLVIIFYLASWVDKKRADLNNFYFGLLPSLCIITLYALLILWQPDFGTMLVLLTVSGAMLFVAGINWKYFFWSSTALVLSLYALVKFEPYRAKRITTFFNPSFDPQGIGYHINQAFLAIGAGGLFGYGYGLSRQKHNYLPEVMTDSILAVTAEELGFVRVLIILLLFLYLAHKGYSIAKSAPDLFGKMVAYGITSWLAFQALINIGAMVNLFPLTGIPLPFFSYGSSALIMNLFAVGILLNISKQPKLKT